VPIGLLRLAAKVAGSKITASPRPRPNRKLASGRASVITTVCASGVAMLAIGSKIHFCALVLSGALARSKVSLTCAASRVPSGR
jgi:hypothetical protein